MEVVSIGFPHLALMTLVTEPIETTVPHLILPNNVAFSQDEFLTWKNGISLQSVTSSNGARPVSTSANPAPAAHILTQIKNFDLSNATPMDCMNFLAGVKKCLNYDLCD